MEWALLGLDFGIVLFSSRFLCVVLCEESFGSAFVQFFNIIKLWVSLVFQIPKLLILPVKKKGLQTRSGSDPVLVVVTILFTGIFLLKSKVKNKNKMILEGFNHLSE
jgi:hypothetical protein